MSEQKPLVIYFDVGGVLMHFYHIRDSVANELGIEPEKFWDFMRSTDLRRADGTLTEQAAEDLLRKEFQLTNPPGFWADMHWMYDFKPITEMHDLAVELDKYYRLGVLTNVTREAYETGRSIPGLWPPVDFELTVRSDLVHLAKPDPRIYEYAIKLAGVKPAEILFVDDMEVNVLAAREAGMQAFQFNPAEVADGVAQLRALLLADKV